MATEETASQTRPVLRGLTLLFSAASVLVLIAAWQLFVLTEHTDRFFAWTIGVPLTAAVDGAFYLAAFFLLFPATRARAWVEVRPLAFGVLCISTLKLVATLLHPDLFHFTEGPATARFAAWGWLAVYVLVPIALAVLIAAELRGDGTDPPATHPMRRGLRWVTGLLAVVLVLIGAGMLLAPSTTAAHWPWPLTPLTSQALSAWFVGIGVLAILMVQDGDVVRARNLWTAALVLPPLQAIALLRYAEAVAWGSFAAWAYVVVFALIGVIGVWGTAATRRPARSSAPAA
jgi:hypothetical protein